MTNNGLERSNGLFKQNYSCGKRLSIPNHMTKICQFLKEQKDMKAQDEKFVSKKQMEDAESFLNTNSEFYRYKKLKGKKNYRTVVKKDFGLICGHIFLNNLQICQRTNLPKKQHQFLNIELILNGMILISLKMTAKTLLLLKLFTKQVMKRVIFLCLQLQRWHQRKCLQPHNFRIFFEKNSSEAK